MISKMISLKVLNLSNDSRFLFSFSHNLKCSYSRNVHPTFSNKLAPKLTESDLTPIDADEKWHMPDVRKVGDINHKSRLCSVSRAHDEKFYLRLIKKAAFEGNTEKILTVFYHDMLIRDRVKPSVFFINILLQKLSELGGHSVAAFEIIRKMKSIRLSPSSVTYSLLFKNCSKEIGNHDLLCSLKNKTVQLLSDEEIMKIQEPATKAYDLWIQLEDQEEYLEKGAINSLLFTLSKAGMLKKGCVVLDKFLQKGQRPCQFTLVAMLEGCLLDRKNGFGLALAFFHKLVYQYKCTLSPYVITALLKIVQHCQFGNGDIVSRIIDASVSSNQPFTALHDGHSDSNKLVPQTNSLVHCSEVDYKKIIEKSAEVYGLAVNDFLESYWSQSDSIVFSLKSPTNMLQKKIFNVFNPQWFQTYLEPSDKLACIGGVLGLLSFLKQNSIEPNIQVLTSLVSCVPRRFIDNTNYNPDDFYVAVFHNLFSHFKMQTETKFSNALFKRNTLFGPKHSKDVIDVSKFDPFTWSIYSRKCYDAKDVKRFFKLMNDSKIIPNNEIFYVLMAHVGTWGARVEVLNKMVEYGIPFDRKIVVIIEDQISKFRALIKTLTTEQANDIRNKSFYLFQKLYANRLDKSVMDPITTGDKKIVIDDLPSEYKLR